MQDKDKLNCLQCGGSDFHIAAAGHKPFVCSNVNCLSRFSIVNNQENRPIKYKNKDGVIENKTVRVIVNNLSIESRSRMN